jgi:hypothetical protein
MAPLAPRKCMAAVHELAIDDTFERSYTLEWLVDMPNSTSIPRWFLPQGSENAGPILCVTSANGRKSLVIIAGDAPKFKVATWPNSAHFLALPGAWLVDAAAPENSRQLRGFDGHTVHYMVPIPDRELVLIGHCCAIYCYGSDGMRWAHEDLFCCDDPSLEVVGDVLRVTAHKHSVDGEGPTLKPLDLLTGERLG